MRVGFRFYSAGQFRELWTTLGKGQKGENWGKIQSVKIEYADFEVTECTVTFTNPSDELIRGLLALCVVEPQVFDEVTYNTGSVWVMDSQFGYDPIPVFIGLILKMNYSDQGMPSASVTMHDFKHLMSQYRDVTDYQNLTDQDIASMLARQLTIGTQDAEGNALIKDVIVDRDEQQARRAVSAVASVRQWSAAVNVDPAALKGFDPSQIPNNNPQDGAQHGGKPRTNPRFVDSTPLQKLVHYAYILGFSVSLAPAKREDGSAYVRATIYPIGGAEDRVAGTYSRGDGQVISFNWDYDPPGLVLQRNIMNKKFDAVNEVWMLQNGLSCIQMDKNGNVLSKSGDELAPGSIRAANQITDQQGNVISPQQYKEMVGPLIKKMADEYGAKSKRKLREYHDQIANRKGLNVPNTTPQTVAAPSSSSDGTAGNFLENMADSGSLFWRMTAKLTVRFNPFITSADSLMLSGWGVFDGPYGIRNFSHTISENPTTSFSLVFGDPVKMSS